jgi:hypothetical protein
MVEFANDFRKYKLGLDLPNQMEATVVITREKMETVSIRLNVM